MHYFSVELQDGMGSNTDVKALWSVGLSILCPLAWEAIPQLWSAVCAGGEEDKEKSCSH